MQKTIGKPKTGNPKLLLMLLAVWGVVLTTNLYSLIVTWKAPSFLILFCMAVCYYFLYRGHRLPRYIFYAVTVLQVMAALAVVWLTFRPMPVALYTIDFWRYPPPILLLMVGYVLLRCAICWYLLRSDEGTAFVKARGESTYDNQELRRDGLFLAFMVGAVAVGNLLLHFFYYY